MPTWLNNINWEYPWVFGLFLLFPLLIYWYVKRRWLHSSALPVTSIDTFGKGKGKATWRHILFLLRLLAMTTLILALARPRERNDEQLTGGQGIDIVLCIDVSGSMLSRDFQPNRLEVAKEVAADFIRQRPIDQIGLVIFSGESFTLSPLTTDKNTLLTQVASLRSGMLQDGTLIGEGLATASARLLESKAKSKVVILLTDGKEQPTEDRLIDPLTALDIARSQNIKVYTIGMALEGYAAVEEKTNQGVVKRGNSPLLDEDLLRKIGRETGGDYFRARDKAGLSKIYEEIDTMEKVKIEAVSFKRIREHFPIFIFLALGFLFLEILLRYTVFRKFP
ncbi:MAG: VWA domain-containing protein [Chitinophagaceae bacterium]|nr:VWA domain-containing protein [Chitinophagaceae bacterium]